MITSYDYDLSSQLTGINHQLNERDLAAYTYTYDLAGRLSHAPKSSRYPNYRFMPLIEKDGGGGLDGLFEQDSLDEFELDGLDEGYPAPSESLFNTESLSNDLLDEGYPAPGDSSYLSLTLLLGEGQRFFC